MTPDTSDDFFRICPNCFASIEETNPIEIGDERIMVCNTCKKEFYAFDEIRHVFCAKKICVNHKWVKKEPIVLHDIGMQFFECEECEAVKAEKIRENKK